MSTITDIIQVNSSAIQRAKFNRQTNTLTLTFKNLAGYDYFNVPLHLFDGLRDSDSKCRFINKYIIGEFKFRKY
jgi:hypothetical protein